MPQSDLITSTVQAAVDQGAFPGAVLWVRRRRRLVYHRAFGQAALDPQTQPATIQTVYDLASLTKPLATATAVLCLVQDRKVRLHDPIEGLLLELKGCAAGRATIFHLLNHSSGLPAWRPLYERIAERERTQPGFLGSAAAGQLVVDLIGQEPLLYPIGSQSLYSDLGFILLGMMVERITGQSLARFCQERIYEPAETPALYFITASEREESMNCRSQFELVAPTESDLWRGRTLRAEVHDENAYAMGGIAGHAGLFGTAAGVASITGLWLESYVGRRSMLSSELVRRFASRQTTPKSSWALGWDTPSIPSSSGKYFSSQAFGHLGFTGTSIWIDPICELEVVLLSNRVHPTRENKAIQRVRPAIHDVVYKELRDGA